MKGLTKFQAFVRGCMIGLAVNMSVLSAVFAQQATIPSANEDPSMFTPPPPGPDVRRAPNPGPFDVQRRIYERLFGIPWTIGVGGYLFDAPILGTGAYTGHTPQGQEFMLTVSVSNEMDMTAGEPTPAELQWLFDHDFSARMVLAALSTPLANAACFGMAVSFLHPSGERQYAFILVGELEYDARVFDLNPGAPAVLPGLLTEPTLPVDPTGLVPGAGAPGEEGPSAECLRCGEEYREGLDAAEEAFDDAVNAARTARDGAIGGAYTAYAAAAADARARYAEYVAGAMTGAIVVLRGCAVAAAVPGGGLVVSGGCVALIGGAMVVAIAFAYRSLQTALAGAAAVRDQAIQTARNTYQAAYNTAANAFEREVDRLDRELEECLRLHQCNQKAPGLRALVDAPAP